MKADDVIARAKANLLTFNLPVKGKEKAPDTEPGYVVKHRMGWEAYTWLMDDNSAQGGVGKNSMRHLFNPEPAEFSPYTVVHNHDQADCCHWSYYCFQWPYRPDPEEREVFKRKFYERNGKYFEE